MALTFVYRSPYDNLTGRYVRKFPHGSILSWFQEVWGTKAADCEGQDICEKLLGKAVYGFDSLFDAIQEHGLPVPRDNAELGKLLEAHVYAEGGTMFMPQALQVFTDDDEQDLRYFLLDDRFIEDNPDRCAFLTYEASLPTGTDTAGASPCAYLYVHSPVQTLDSQVWDAVTCPGVRLDDPVAVIEAYEALDYAEAEDVLDDLSELKSARLTWRDTLAALAKKERGSEDREGNDSQLICADHICQLHHHACTWEWGKLFHQVVLFDDVWAASHPHLESSLRFYASDGELI